MTGRENALHAIMHDGKAEYIPSMADFEMIMPTNVVRERPPYALGIGGSGYDYWGCWWEYEDDIGGASPLPGKEPCPDITQWREKVTFPDIDAIDWTPAHEVRDSLDRENKLSMFFWESGPWERLHALVGFQNALEAMYEEPEAFKELMQAITDYRVKMIPLIKEHYNPDIIINLDDFGHQRSQFMSTEMFREFIKPYEKQIYDAMKANDIIRCHHSCGNIDKLVEDIYDMGAEMILGLFYPYNDQPAVVEKMGGKLLFLMATNAQVLDSGNATVDDAMEDAMRQLTVFGPHDALIFTPGGSPELAGAMMQCYFQHRDEYNPYKTA